MWPEKVKFKVWPQVKVTTWLKYIMMHNSRFVSIRQTHQTCFEACISSQSKVIARTLLVTYDDVTRPPLLIAEVSGAPVKWLVNTTFCMFWLLMVVLTQIKMKWNLPHWLIMGGHKIDLTLGHRYKKSEIYIFLCPVILSKPCKF